MNGLLLGWTEDKDSNTLTPIWDTGHEGHLLTMAPTGGGKGVSCAIPALLTWRGPAIVVDPKGENYAVTAERRRQMGHLVHRLDPFSIAGDDIGDSLNPMDLIDPHSDCFEDNAAVVAKLCMQEHASHNDPFWDERATAMIVAVICELFRALKRQPTLKDVQEAIRGAPIADEFSQAVMHAHGMIPEKPRGISMRHVITSSEFSSDKTRASIMATAQAHMGFLRSPSVHASLTSSTIPLDDITAGAMQTIYLIIPPDKLISHGKLLRLWIGVMLAAIARRKRAPQQPTLFLIDETAQLGHMSDLKAAITLMRSYGMRVWTFWQDLSQLKAVYPRDWETIINNSAVQQYFGAKSPPARQALSEYLGKFYPSEGLPEESLLLLNGEHIKTAKRSNYLVDPVFNGLAAPHPFHRPQDELVFQ
ncbi:type IV secretory system conjugative DNA transfer family protein [Hyphomicrobium sp.]|uniref:type IV secretory system conjugative DNA transfer family protein n=1 Tax=Hyphomicrobium sp. TaxID=82 RepID=UPI002E37B113|nr:type IV secretory system conjugative DNA transfer family protein [Hyphomicrobium sp.]HEX2842114.1 type IV secretory system conjugative DNA transfer family protein [Hyphomicrobium sp.]